MPEIDCAAVLGSTAPRETAADCVGLSERRAFGLCRLSGFLCERPAPGASPTPDSSACEEMYGDECACMRLAEQVAAGREDEAVFVLADACRAYRARYPESVECMDVDWNPLE